VDVDAPRIEHSEQVTWPHFLWHRVEMPQYRAFDKRGNLIGSQEISDSDTAIAWAIAIVHHGAALFDRKSGDEWVCFLEYRNGQLGNKKK
jgi:hypothetical protein